MEPKLICALVFAGLVVLAAMGVLVYVFVLAPQLSHVTVVGPNPLSYSPGDQVTIRATARSIATFVVQFSDDGGMIYSTLSERATLPMKWTIPLNVYSKQCLVRVFDPRNPLSRTATSSTFAVEPVLFLTSDIMHANVEIYVPGNITFKYSVNTNLITSQNLKIQISGDAFTFVDAPLQDTFAVFPDGRIVWDLTADLKNQSKYVRVTTTDLVSRGFPSELMATTKTPVKFLDHSAAATSSSGSSSVSELMFAHLTARNDEGGHSGASFAPHRALYLQYEVESGSVDLARLKWSWSNDKGKTYHDISADTMLVQNTLYVTHVPAVVPALRFRVSDGNAYAFTPDTACLPVLDFVQLHYLNGYLEAVVHSHGTLLQSDLAALPLTLASKDGKSHLALTHSDQQNGNSDSVLVLQFASSVPPQAGSEFVLKLGSVLTTSSQSVKIL